MTLAQFEFCATILFVAQVFVRVKKRMEDKMKVRLILVLGLVLLASACATVKPATATEADQDSAYIYNVETGAFGRATRIIWVNPPKHKAQDSKD